MKKTQIIVALCLLSWGNLSAQVTFNTYSSLEELMKKAKKEKKLIFIQVESEECVQCNDVAMTGLSSKQLKEKYDVNFLSTKIKETDKWGVFLKEKLNKEKLMGSVYLDSKGNLLSNHAMTTSNTLSYINWADKAIENSTKIIELMTFENEYKKGNKSPQFLEKYILTLRVLEKDSEFLMDEYVAQISNDSFCSPRILKFMMEQGSAMNSQTHKKIGTACKPILRDSIWRSFDLNTRTQINNRIISNTTKEAIKSKNIVLARDLANFVGNTYGRNDRPQAEIARRTTLIGYFKNIKDTVSFIEEAQRFADGILMKVSDDSLKQWDLKQREAIYAQRTAEKRFTLISSKYATELNNLSWSFYLMNDNPTHLAKALAWTKRAMEIHAHVLISPYPENAGYLDTYAHLNYKLKQFDEAVLWETKAVEAQKTAGLKSAGFEEKLEKMKNRKL